MSKLPKKSVGALAAILALVLVFALGCSNSDQPTQSSAVSTGSQVGDTIHPFSLRLADGSMVTSANLIGQGRPTFLMFFQHP